MVAVSGKAIFAALICLCKKDPSIQIEVKRVAKMPVTKRSAMATGTK